VSDHSPCTADRKARGGGDFGLAWGGIASVQVALPAVWTAARERGVPLAEVARLMATAPADRVGLPRKGRIAVGADADLCVFAPDDSFVVDPAALRQRNPVSAYAGARLHGVVRRTYLRGTEVDPDGAPRGRLLRRGQRGRAPTATTPPPAGCPGSETSPRTARASPRPMRCCREARCATSSPATSRIGWAPGCG
jgi:allantoinase